MQQVGILILSSWELVGSITCSFHSRSESPETCPSMIAFCSGGSHRELEGDTHHRRRGAGQSPARHCRLRVCPYI